MEYAERAALNRHAMWSSLVVDLILGNLIGLPVLVYARSVCSHVTVFANSFTNEVLRSGCVWLMGVPAGFKLNIELAGVLGMVSLNVIQIWSTLWMFAGFLFIHFISGLALFAILFGATVSAAVIMDVILLASLHVSMLHWAISLLYSRQIQALASLWRLFRYSFVSIHFLLVGVLSLEFVQNELVFALSYCYLWFLVWHIKIILFIFT